MEPTIAKQISEELGRLASDLQPIAQTVWEAAFRQSYTLGYGSLGTMLFVGLVGGLCIVFLIKRINKERAKDGWHDECILEWIGIICIACCIAAAIGFGILNGFQLLNPEWYAIERILTTSKLSTH